MGSVRSLGLMGLLVALCAVTVLATAVAYAEQPEDRSEGPSIDCVFRPPEPIARHIVSDMNAAPSDLDVAAAADGTVHAVYLAEGWQVLYSRRVAGEAGFRAPVRMNTPNTTCYWPQVELAPNGTVHVLWLEYPHSAPAEIRWAYSLDNGENWTTRVLEGGSHIDDLAFTVQPSGIPALLCSITYWGAGQSRSPVVNALEYFSWSMSGEELFRTIIYNTGEGFKDLRIAVSSDGTTHCTYIMNSTLRWRRSDDGGRTWSGETTIKTGQDWTGEYRAAAMPGGRLALAWTGPFSPTGPNGTASHPAGRQLSWTVAGNNGPTNFNGRIYNVSSHHCHPTAFGLVARDDEVCVVFLGFNRNRYGELVTDGQFYLPIYSFNIKATWGSDDPWYAGFSPSSYWYYTNGTLEDEYSRLQLAMCLEQGLLPVAVTSLFEGQGTFDLCAWRVNHAPTVPTCLSEAAGGWVLGTSITLETTEAFDADGDTLRYSFECRSLDGERIEYGVWIDHPRVDVAGLRHGAYLWGVTVRDSHYAESSADCAWWFRVDTGPPIADAGLTYSIVEGGVLYLYGGRSRDDGPIVRWEWDWDGDGVFDSREDDPTLEVLVDIDGRWNVTLRITDEAGRNDTDSTIVNSIHLEPEVYVTGPTDVDAGGPPCPFVVIIEPMFRHIYACAWYIDGVGPVVGGEVHLSFDEVGMHFLAVRVTDEVGRPLNGQLTVMAHWVGPAKVSIMAPAEVYVGEVYQVRAVPVYLNESAEWTFSWNRDGEPVGGGRSIALVAQRAPSETIDLSYNGSDGSHASAEVIVSVREHLRASNLSLMGNAKTTSIRVTWTACGQPMLFVRYIVRISSASFDRADLPNLDWMASAGANDPYVATDINTTNCTFWDLSPGTFYHLSVYTEGGGEVVMSDVVVALTQAVREGPDDGGDGGWPSVGPEDIAVFVVAAAVVVAMAAYRIRKVRRDGKQG
jgi:hypothetical protein